ncbi:hypothetical protein [Microbacterium sp. J1-1]|nr:hypothetical protein [Microbacterium sp. J1-1]UUE20084.1 hypothetical protein LRQ07_14995 [Microbacterium sp. J1-1]
MATTSCPYGDAHTTVLDIAREGGADLSTGGHSQVLSISPIIGGIFSVGSDARTRTFREDGAKLTPKEAARWREAVAAIQEIEAEEIDHDAPEPSAEEMGSQPAQPPRAKPTSRFTNAKNYALAEGSKDPGILSQLAHSPDWNVRLLVARNPATSTDTLEQLATSADKDAKRYRDAAHEELGHRYEDMRDAAELEACARMDADGVFQQQVAKMPSYRQLAYMPAKRWARKSVPARRTLLAAAFDEAARLFKLGARFAGWSELRPGRLFDAPKNRTARSNYMLPGYAARLNSPMEVLGLFASVFASLFGSIAHQTGVRKKLGLGPV